MSTKKLTQSSYSSKIFNFRTIIKDRANKQTINNQAPTITTKKQSNDEIRTVKSINYVRSTRLTVNDKLKKYVRNMKQQKNKNPEPIKRPTIHNQDDNKSVTSSRSIRSNQSMRFKMNNKPRKDQDCQSVVSTRSLAESKFISKSKSFVQKDQQQNQLTLNVEQKLQLSKLEQKLNYLIYNKLRNMSLKTKLKNKAIQRPFFGPNRSIALEFKNQSQSPTITILNKQIDEILQEISVLKNKQSQENLNIEEDLVQLNKKIQLLQKVIASSFTEGQILKKYYFGQKSQKQVHLNRRQTILNEINKRKQALRNNSTLIQKKLSINQQNVLKYQSSSSHFYKKLSSDHYNISKQKHASFVANRQPLPRSMYGVQFLNYGTIPVFNYKPHDCTLDSMKMTSMTSSYQQSFKDKNIEMKQINYKDLDCVKDKIKPTNISFSELYRKQQKKNNKSKLGHNQKISIEDDTLKVEKIDVLKNQSNNQHNQKQQYQGQNSKIRNNADKTSATHNNNNSKIKFVGESQMKSSFNWANLREIKSKQANRIQTGSTPKNLLQSVIKNKNLNNLKSSYKMSFIR